jgi:acetyl-CoA/propionyl-CoA carboxylase biotin carboxyl carrier protein
VRDYVLLGVKTNADYLDAILAHPGFTAGEVSTGFLAEEAEALRERPDAARNNVLIAATALSDSRLVAEVESVPAIYRKMGAWRN